MPAYPKVRARCTPKPKLVQRSGVEAKVGDEGQERTACRLRRGTAVRLPHSVQPLLVGARGVRTDVAEQLCRGAAGQTPRHVSQNRPAAFLVPAPGQLVPLCIPGATMQVGNCCPEQREGRGWSNRLDRFLERACTQ